MLKINIKKIAFNGLVPIDLFESIQHLPNAILLDSCNDDNSNPKQTYQYSILSHSPVIKVQSQNGHLSVQNNSPNLVIEDVDKFTHAFELLSHLQQQLMSQIDVTGDTSLPFLCGWLGAFGYDLNIDTDQIDRQGVDEYDLPVVDVGFYSNAIIYNHQEQIYYWVSIGNNSPDWLSAFDKTPKAESEFTLETPWASNVSKQEYLLKIQRIKQYLTQGDCYQVNFAQRYFAEYSGSEFDAYKRLRTHNKAPFSAYANLDSSIIMSVSPERFLSVNNATVETKPIKGTMPRHDDPSMDEEFANALLQSEKDRAENLMIVDLLRNDLSKHCKPSSVKVPKLFALESYPAVHHLVSTVQGKLRETSSAFDLLGGAFPGGSITGCPKVRAMQVISELEPNKRSIYCGSIGYIGIRDDMDVNICIRTVLAEKGKLYCWAGGGIVIDSNAESEYKETQDKVAKILPVLENNTRGTIEGKTAAISNRFTN